MAKGTPALLRWAGHQENDCRTTLSAPTEDRRMAGQLLGFIGIGRMGNPMAAHLLDAGYSLCIYDTKPEATQALVARGAKLAASPAEVASMAEIVLMSLPTPAIVNVARAAYVTA